MQKRGNVLGGETVNEGEGCQVVFISRVNSVKTPYMGWLKTIEIDLSKSWSTVSIAAVYSVRGPLVHRWIPTDVLLHPWCLLRKTVQSPP